MENISAKFTSLWILRTALTLETLISKVLYMYNNSFNFLLISFSASPVGRPVTILQHLRRMALPDAPEGNIYLYIELIAMSPGLATHVCYCVPTGKLSGDPHKIGDIVTCIRNAWLAWVWDWNFPQSQTRPVPEGFLPTTEESFRILQESCLSVWRSPW